MDWKAQWDNALKAERAHQQNNIDLIEGILKTARLKANPTAVYERLTYGRVKIQGHLLHRDNDRPKRSKSITISVPLYTNEGTNYIIKGDDYQYSIKGDSLFRIYKDIKGLPSPKTTTMKTIKKDKKLEARIEIAYYSEKAIALFGETKPHKDKLKALGCKFNPFLRKDGKKAPGWIASKKRESEIRKFVEAL